MIKPGYKTSEFWFTLVSFIFSGLYLLGVITDSNQKEELIYNNVDSVSQCMEFNKILDYLNNRHIIDEGLSTVVDTEIAIDLASRFLAQTTPKEIFIVLNGSGKMSIDDIIEYLQIDKNIINI